MKDKDMVGYKNPPQETRFKPGVSGNPKGRPRQNLDHSMQSLVEKYLNEKVLVNFKGKQVRKTCLEIFSMKLVELLIKGDLKAYKILMKYIDKTDTNLNRHEWFVELCMRAEQENEARQAESKI